MTAAVLAVLLALAPPAPADLFADANRRYQEGAFAEALDGYRHLTEQGYHNATLFYNIGNCYFKLGELGKAILHYERALRLSPGDDDVEANLALARSLTVDEVTPAPRFWLFRVVEWWVTVLPRQALILTVGFAWFALAGAVTLRILARGPVAARWGTRGALVAAGCVVAFGTNLAVRELEIGRPEEAIIMPSEVAVQSAPTADPSLQVFAIHEGTKVRIHRSAEGWSEIVLEDGKVGWVPVEAIERI